MPVQFFSTQVSVEERVAKILLEQKITSTDRRVLWRTLLCNDVLDEEEVILIERVFYGMRHGLLQLVD